MDEFLGEKITKPSVNNTFLLHSRPLGLDYENAESYTESFAENYHLSDDYFS